MAGDDETRAIVLFLETVRRPVVLPASSRGLRRRGQARTLPHGRPFGRRAPGRASHAGASVSSDRAFSALLRTTGAQRADGFHEFVETLEVLGRGRWPRGGRIGGISESGGECALLADHAELVGIPFAPMPEPLARQLALEFPNYGSPQNPLDAWAVGEPMSDRVAVMNAGHVEQIGSPAEVYEDPPMVFVADFLGGSNVMEADGVSGDAQSCMVRVGEFTLRGGCGDLGARGR